MLSFLSTLVKGGSTASSQWEIRKQGRSLPVSAEAAALEIGGEIVCLETVKKTSREQEDPRP